MKRPEVHLWPLRLNLALEPNDEEEAVLSPDELERAARFRFSADRNRFIRRHLHLRTVLALYLGEASSNIPLATPLNNPPRLIRGAHASNLRFSLSSSAGYAAVAVAWRRPVGVDVEKIRSTMTDLEVAKRFFSPSENAALRSVTASSRALVFFRIWTRKEAFVKGLGVGLERELASFDVMDPDRFPPGKAEAIVIDRERSDAAPWLVRDGHLAPDCALACAAAGDDWSLIPMDNPP